MNEPLITSMLLTVSLTTYPQRYNLYNKFFIFLVRWILSQRYDQLRHFLVRYFRESTRLQELVKRLESQLVALSTPSPQSPLPSLLSMETTGRTSATSIWDTTSIFSPINPCSSPTSSPTH